MFGRLTKLLHIPRSHEEIAQAFRGEHPSQVASQVSETPAPVSEITSVTLPEIVNVNAFQPEEEKHMSFLSTIGKDFKAVFSWLGSSKGQAVVQSSEGLILAGATAFGAGAPVAAAEAIINSWVNKIIQTESLAAAAGQQDGTGTQKAAAVLSAITPELDKYFPNTSAQTAAIITTALVTVLNALGTPASTPAAPAQTPAPKPAV